MVEIKNKVLERLSLSLAFIRQSPAEALKYKSSSPLSQSL